MRVFLVAGSPEARRPDGIAPAPGDRVIAVDSGLVHVRAWSWPVHLLIGDLDSLPERDVPEPGALPVITAPAAKDETDLELGLRQALAWGAGEVIICAALGGRPDHTLANILLLTSRMLAGIDVHIAEGGSTLRLLRGPAELGIAGEPGDLLSLLPVGGPAAGVVTQALRYPLRNETLDLGEPRGMSNVFLSTTAHVALREGILLVYHHPAAADRADV